MKEKNPFDIVYKKHIKRKITRDDKIFICKKKFAKEIKLLKNRQILMCRKSHLCQFEYVSVEWTNK